MPRRHQEEVEVEPGLSLNLAPELIKQLVHGALDQTAINE
uniref:Transposase n=1 Tax=Ralstonia solanacearum TaxID=305 RepID=A0A0S4TUI0_RALSL